MFSDREESKPAENPCRSPRSCSQQQKGQAALRRRLQKLSSFLTHHTASLPRRPPCAAQHCFVFLLLFFGFRFPTESSVLCATGCRRARLAGFASSTGPRGASEPVQVCGAIMNSQQHFGVGLISSVFHFVF